MRRITRSRVARIFARVITRRSRAAGFSLAETTIILSAAAVLTATAAPSVMDYVAQARGIKAAGDVQVLTSALSRLMFDVGRFAPAGTGTEPELMVGPGENVEIGDGGNTVGWAAPLDGTRVQNLDDHLITNTIGYRSRGEGAFAKGWGGPYLDAVPVDPWGRRYGVNLGALGSGPVIILSAGANGKAETPFKAPGLRIGGDDIVGLMGSRR